MAHIRLGFEPWLCFIGNFKLYKALKDHLSDPNLCFLNEFATTIQRSVCKEDLRIPEELGFQEYLTE